MVKLVLPGLIMSGDFVSQLNLGALMLAELRGYLTLPRAVDAAAKLRR